MVVRLLTQSFLMGWSLVLGLKEGLVECVTVCVKSWVILIDLVLLVCQVLERIRNLRIKVDKIFLGLTSNFNTITNYKKIVLKCGFYSRAHLKLVASVI